LVQKIGIISVSDERPNANERIKPAIEKQCRNLLDILYSIGTVQPVIIEEPVNSPSTARKAGLYLRSKNVAATLFNVPTFGFPRFGLIASKFAPGPYMLISQMDPNQPSPAGIAGIGGSMTQLGIPHERLWADLAGERAKKEIEAFISAATAVHGLNGLVFGLFGGRSMGLNPMVSSTVEFSRKFGIDVDHIDQLEIIRRSEEIAEQQVEKAVAWLGKNARSVQFDDILTQEKLRAQIRNYEALKIIIREREIDFSAVKCHYELSEYQQPMCIAAMFCNDPYDWDGEKQPHVFACEADADGALTMQILKLLSSSKPTCLLDIRYYHETSKTFLFQNCGTAPSWFACRSHSPKDNLGKVDFCSCVPKFKGGGAQTSFWFGEGDLTLARLYQAKDGYHMVITRAKAIDPLSISDMPTGEAHWPKVAIKMNTTPELLLQKMNCVHLHAVEGDYKKNLELVCKYLDIVPEVIELS